MGSSSGAGGMCSTKVSACDEFSGMNFIGIVLGEGLGGVVGGSFVPDGFCLLRWYGSALRIEARHPPCLPSCVRYDSHVCIVGEERVGIPKRRFLGPWGGSGN